MRKRIFIIVCALKQKYSVFENKGLQNITKKVNSRKKEGVSYKEKDYCRKWKQGEGGNFEFFDIKRVLFLYTEKKENFRVNDNSHSDENRRVGNKCAWQAKG